MAYAGRSRTLLHAVHQGLEYSGHDLAIGAWGLWRSRLPLFQGDGAAGWTNALGAGMLVTASLYLLASMFRRHPRLAERSYDLPTWRIASAQYLLSKLDWMLSAAVLWVLLPDQTPAFAHVAVAFVVAQFVGAASHLPGGIGAFGAAMVAQMQPLVPMEGLLFVLIAFRGIYSVAPCLVAIGMLVADEGRVDVAAKRPPARVCRRPSAATDMTDSLERPAGVRPSAVGVPDGCA